MYKTNDPWRSVDTHFQDGAQSVPQLLLTLKAANTLIMNVCNQSPRRWPKMQSQVLVTHSWRSFSECGNDHVAFFLAYKGSQYIH